MERRGIGGREVNPSTNWYEVIPLVKLFLRPAEESARKGEVDPVIGRESDIERVI